MCKCIELIYELFVCVNEYVVYNYWYIFLRGSILSYVLLNVCCINELGFRGLNEYDMWEKLNW